MLHNELYFVVFSSADSSLAEVQLKPLLRSWGSASASPRQELSLGAESFAQELSCFSAENQQGRTLKVLLNRRHFPRDGKRDVLISQGWTEPLAEAGAGLLPTGRYYRSPSLS